MEEKTNSNWYDKYYKILLLPPVLLVILSLVYLSVFYSTHNDLFYKDISLSGGTTITLTGNIDDAALEAGLREKFADVGFRKLTDLSTGSQTAYVIESSANSDSLTSEIESILGYKLDDSNSSIEFTGPSLSANFYKQLMYSLLISFILMSIVIFFLFRTFIPSLAVIFAAFSDIIFPLAILDLLGIKISAAGVAAFLMLIGYSVDTDILLTSRAIKTFEGTLNHRIYGAFKTGIFMTSTAIFAVIPAFFIFSGLPDSFRQIFLILGLGLVADIFNTWLTNASLIKWYCTKKGIN